MYKNHATFLEPKDEEIKVWRYMDFTKLVSLIDSRRLYFTRADKFEDVFEGSWPKRNVTEREQFLGPKGDMGEKFQQFPRYHAINCWHMNEHESAAMWRLYLKSDEGIAIQSTYAKLKKSLIDDEEIYLGKVKYIDYDTGYIDPGNSFGSFVHKRKSFEYEQEVRAIISKWPIVESRFDFTQETIVHGLEINVDIETLIERIYVAPSGPGWFADLVKAVITKYGYNFEVLHSKLDENPVF